MPHDNPYYDNTSSDGARAEGVRAAKSTNGSTPNAPLGETGARNVKAGLRMQKEMFDILQDIGHDWFARAASEAELALDLPHRLSAAQTVPDALSAYQEWLSEWMNRFDEDGRSFIADSRRLMDAGARCLKDASPTMTS